MLEVFNYEFAAVRVDFFARERTLEKKDSFFSSKLTRVPCILLLYYIYYILRVARFDVIASYFRRRAREKCALRSARG